MSDETRVAVYRGPATCDGCPESAADLVESALEDVKITYVGPDEDVDISKSSLKEFDVYIQPGGGDLDPGWKDMKRYAEAIREFVSGGGYYVGICLGAYLAGDDPGFGILPDGVDADEESAQDDAEVKGEEDTVIRVNWTFSSGKKKGKTEDNRWLYFQDGASIMGKEKTLKKEGKVLGRYSKSGDVAAYVASYGKGVVGVVGPHPEATKDWYEDEGIKNPNGYDLDIGRDFIRAVVGYKACE
ncbi:Bromodomain protein [Sarocladium implicatum]|nr:Bromodomain protein [Sarocladium implicatum]